MLAGWEGQNETVPSGQETEEEKFLEYVRGTALPELKAGNAEYGNILQRVFLKFPQERGLQVEIAAAYEEWLRTVSAKKLIRVSEEYRNYYDGYFVEDDAADWWITKPRREDYPHLMEGQYAAVLKFGTFSADGFDRQWCMEALDGMEGSLAFFFLRVNDWVGEIRRSAFSLAKKRVLQCGADEFFFALPMLEKVAACGRREQEHVRCLTAQVKQRSAVIFKEMPESLLAARLPYYGVNVKNAIYRLLAGEKILPLASMERLLLAERTGYGKKLLLSGIFSHYGYDKERVGRYLAARSALVRHLALWFRYEHEQGAWEGLERMLADASKKVRSGAALILQKHTTFSVLGYYLGQLRQKVSAVALLGVGEHGTKQEASLVAPYLAEEGSTLAKAALTAYGRLAAADGEAVYWKFLFDERPTLAKTAYRLIRKNRIHYGAGELYRLFGEQRGTVTGKYLFELLMREPSWERLPYLLELYAGGGLTQEQEGQVARAVGCRYVYAAVSGAQEEKIMEALARGRGKFPDGWEKGILFDLAHVAKK